MTGAEIDLVAACRDIRLLASFWWAAWLGMTIVAISFGAMYHFGVRFRIPRMRSTMKRLARERDAARVEAATMKRKAEVVAAEAQKAIDAEKARTDAEKDRVRRRDEALRKTEERLLAQNAELVEAKDLARTMEALLEAVNAHHATPAEEPASGDSWVDQASIDAASGAQAAK